MALTHQSVFLQDANINAASFTNSDAANTKKTIVTAGDDGTKVIGLIATSTDTSDRLGQVWLTRSATSYLLGSINVPTLSGTNGSAATVDLLDIAGLPEDNDGQNYTYLRSGDTLQVSFTTQVTAAKQVDVVAIYADF